MKVSIVVFEINEIDGMRVTLPQIKPEWYHQLIVVDGGSTDGSIEFCRDNGYDYFVQKEKGPGAALQEAMDKVTGDVVIIYAPDGSFLVDRIPMIIEKLREGYDLVNVSRYYPGSTSEDDTFATAMGNRLFTWLANLVFRVKLTDFLYTYLGYRTAMIKELKINNHERAWGQVLLLRAIKAKLRIVEIPGPEPARVGGEVKVPKIKAAWSLIRVITRERFSSKGDY